MYIDNQDKWHKATLMVVMGILGLIAAASVLFLCFVTLAVFYLAWGVNGVIFPFVMAGLFWAAVAQVHKHL